MGVQEINHPGIEAFRLFRSIREKDPNAFFFESSPSIGAAPETSVIGLGPFEKMRERLGRVELIKPDGSIELAAGDFFELLDARLKLLNRPGEHRFEGGGYFGCIGYEAASLLEPSLARVGRFRDAASGIRAEVVHARRLIVFDHIKKTVALIEPDDRFEELKSLIANAHAARPGRTHSKRVRSGPLKASLGRSGFAARLGRLKGHIGAGDVFQAVLAERFEMELAPELARDPLVIQERLRESSPAPYSFCFPSSDGVFFGASPEALVKVVDGRVRTYPIAGTRPRGEDAASDRRLERNLLRSRKEAAEHLMLVDLARNDVGRVARPGTVAVEKFRAVERLENVMHLVSEVGGELNASATALDAFRACFPAGTLSGAPKVRAMEILADLEKTPRGLYGGAIVAFDSSGGLDSCIAFRSLETHGSTAILRAGAGIVADSKPDFEYSEIEHKLASLLRAISRAEEAV